MARRLPTILLAMAVAAIAAAPATAKEGVVATLETPVPLDAASGAEVSLAWTLTSVDADGTEQPFGAQGVYVTLVSAAGGEPTTGYADGGSDGRYAATAIVPGGGIGGIQIALMGWASGEPAPVAFPIANNPLPEVTGETLIPAPAVEEPAPAQPPAEPKGGSSVVRLALGLAVLVTLAAVAVVALRRRRPLSSA
ncbi:MAG: hypothetical protein ACRDNG_14730 [Gaiellaceae bacterium]